jgi:hypothetical protein
MTRALRWPRRVPKDAVTLVTLTRFVVKNPKIQRVSVTKITKEKEGFVAS